MKHKKFLSALLAAALLVTTAVPAFAAPATAAEGDKSTKTLNVSVEPSAAGTLTYQVGNDTAHQSLTAVNYEVAEDTAEIKLTAQANTDYEFATWKIDDLTNAGTGNDKAYTVSYTNMTDTTTIKAVFNPKLTVSVNDGNLGSVTTNPNASYIAAGATVVLTANFKGEADTVNWGTFPTGAQEDKVNHTLTFNMPETPTMITVTFSKSGEPVVEEYTVKYDLNGGEGTAPTDTKKYAANASVTLADGTGLTKEGFTFKGWATTANATTALTSPWTLVAPTQGTVVTLYAVWEKDPVYINVTATAGTDGTNKVGGTIEPSGVRKVLQGKEIGKVTVTPASGYTISRVTKNGVDKLAKDYVAGENFVLDLGQADTTDIIVRAYFAKLDSEGKPVEPTEEEKKQTAAQDALDNIVTVDPEALSEAEAQELLTTIADAPKELDVTDEHLEAIDAVAAKAGLPVEVKDVDATAVPAEEQIESVNVIGLGLLGAKEKAQPVIIPEQKKPLVNDALGTALSIDLKLTIDGKEYKEKLPVPVLVTLAVPAELVKDYLNIYHTATDIETYTKCGAGEVATPANRKFEVDTGRDEVYEIRLYMSRFSTLSFATKAYQARPTTTYGGGSTGFSGYWITAEAGPNGSISPAGENKVEFGDSMTFTVTPNAGYVVDKVVIDGTKEVSLTNGQYTFKNVNEPYTIKATFKSASGSAGTPAPETTPSTPAAVNPPTGDSWFAHLFDGLFN